VEADSTLGCALFALPAGSTLVRTAAGRLFTVGQTTALVEQALAGSDDVFAQAGELRVIATADLPRRWSAVDCVVVGTGRLATVLAEVMGCRRLEETDDPAKAFDDEPRVTVLAHDVFDEETERRWAEQARETGATFLAAHVEHETVSVGPLSIAGATSDAVDLMGRRLVSARHPAHFSALAAGPAAGTSPLEHDDLAWVALELAARLREYLATGRCALVFREMVADPLRRHLDWHVVLPLPDRVRSLAETKRWWASGDLPSGLEALYDRRTGPIVHAKRLPHDHSVPASLISYQAFAGQLSRLYPWSNSRVCGGSSFLGEADARIASMGEVVERYSGNVIDPTRIRQATFDEIIVGGEQAVDPDELVLYSEAQYETAGFPFEPLRRDSVTQWVDGRDLDGTRVWLPASMSYVNWHSGPYRGEPAHHSHHYAGVAAGPDLERAVLGGLEEVVERDITMIWWTAGHRLPTLDVSGTRAERLVAEAAELGQRLSYIALPNPFDIPVVVAVLWQADEKLLNVGFGCKPDPVHAALKAATEAFTLQEGSRDLDKPNGLYRAGAVEAIVSDRFLKPWRADRLYLDDYHPQFRDVNVLLCQQQLFLDPRAQEAVRPLLDTPVRGHIEDIARPAEFSIEEYRRLVERHGYRVLYADLTTPDVELTGVRVARTIVPGLVGNFPAAFPLLGRDRIRAAPVELGWRSSPVVDDELNLWPLPHA